VLKFSEIYFSRADQKVFDVSIGDTTVIKDLDPFYRAYGKFLPYDHFVDIMIKSGKIFIDSKEVRGAIRTEKAEKYLVVDFKKGRADNPKINALVLVKGSSKYTH